MAIVTDTVNYFDGDTVLQGFFAYDDAHAGTRPAVLVSHAWAGRNGFATNKAIQLAELGYVGFALDLYGNAVVGATNDDCARLMQPFMDDRALLRQRILAALTAVNSLPWTARGKVAAIGFCFGGLCVLDLARSGADIQGVVSFHGLLQPPVGLDCPPVTAKILALHGHDDPMVPVGQVVAFEQEMTAAGADWQLHVYGHTLHAFTNPLANDPDFGTVYQASADRRSWQAMVNFLAEVL